MYQGTTTIAAEKIFGNPRDAGLIMNDKDGSEMAWTWPKEIGVGLMSRTKLRTGLALGLADFRILDDILISFDHMFMPVTFNFCASWNKKYCILCKEDQNELRLAGSGCGSISYRPEWHGKIDYPCKIPIRFLTVCVNPSLLNSFMDSQYDRFPTGLYDITSGDYERSFEQTFMITSSVNMVIHQIFDCQYQGALKRFYLEAKTLELITYAMSQILTNRDGSGNNTVLYANDIKRVQDAKDILLSNFEKPPTLLELASQVGTNKNKLTRDFQQVFGASVFEYLRTSRLEHARLLLESKKMSVTDAAFEVGYAHARNFARAFKNHFGTNPKDHLY